MPLYVRPKNWTLKPPIGSTINWGHPLAEGIKAVFLFNEIGSPPRNLVTNKVYSYMGSPTWETKYHGWTLVSDANLEGVRDTLEPSLKLTKKVSALWRGSFNGTPTANAAIFGATYDNANGSPFLSYAMYSNASSLLTYGTNNGGFQNTAGPAISTYADNRVHNFLLAIQNDASGAANNSNLFVDNANLAINGSQAGDITYSSTAQLEWGEPFGTGISRTNTECSYIWNRKLTASESAWLWAEPYALIQPPNPVIRYFFFQTGASQALAATVGSQSEIVIAVENQKDLSSVVESATSVEAGMIADRSLSSIIDSGSEITTLLYKDTFFPSTIIESQSSINPLLGFIHYLTVDVESASEIDALLGKQVPFDAIVESATSIYPSLSRVFTGGIAAFDIALQILSPTAVLDTGNRPVAFLFSDNDNESSFNPDLPNSSPGNDSFF